MTNFLSSSILTASMNNMNINRTSNVSGTNRNQTNNSISSITNEDDQLNRINLQALQNRDPYISKIIDQAQRVCVYKFIAEKRQWVTNVDNSLMRNNFFCFQRNAKNSKELYLSMKGLYFDGSLKFSMSIFIDYVSLIMVSSY